MNKTIPINPITEGSTDEEILEYINLLKSKIEDLQNNYCFLEKEHNKVLEKYNELLKNIS